LIHRDYHQANVLFEDGRLIGVVDWTAACTGPVGIDLAQMRMNLAWEFDVELADAFPRRVGGHSR
jgi:aminoglycoside phosphotransferase (APT) family kinase protein